MSGQTQTVIAILEHALMDPKVLFGRRLRPERDLAVALGYGRRQLNEALSHLAQRGILSRTRGSGTYVVSKPEPSAERAADLRKAWDESGLAATDDIFAPDDPAASVRAARGSGGAFRLCLCGDWLDASPIHQATVERMLATVQRLGHALSIVSALDETGRPLPTASLRHRLQTNPADGYLVVSRWGEAFLRATKGIERPTIYCGNVCGIRHEPAVGVCPHQATAPALRRLSEGGYARIALLGYHQPANPFEPQQDAYEQAAEALGLTYRQCELVRLGDVRSGAAVRRLLKSADRPDAIYLSDEFLAPAVIDAAETLGITFGRDLGMICLSNRGISDLPDNWSRFEVDIRLAGQLAAETLVHMLETGEEFTSNLLLHPRWQPRATHSLRSSDPTRAEAGASTEAAQQA